MGKLIYLDEYKKNKNDLQIFDSLEDIINLDLTEDDIINILSQADIDDLPF